jgi:carbon-monoxide dehydrogenase small subunit
MSMKTIQIQVNGQSTSKQVAPRTHLGDFLRDQLQLTGTHLGCEHGVCGACTVLVDGAPVRSCITYAVACDGQAITTIEGYDQDPVMRRLREAFSAHHALQCGYCTPGMLATARDIVLRLPEADEARVRIELAGNICRCTGYMGIVAAIISVLRDLSQQPDADITALRGQQQAHQGPVLGSSASADAAQRFEGFRAQNDDDVSSRLPAETPESSAVAADTKTVGTKVEGSFEVAFDADEVWVLMTDLRRVAGCLPGAKVDAMTGPEVTGSVSVKFGPMSASFKGRALLEVDAQQRQAVLRGSGQDALSQSRATGDVLYRVLSLGQSRSKVTVELTYVLQGPLAQFSRSGLVQEFVRRMIADFGRNVAGVLQDPVGQQASVSTAINPLAVFASILWSRIKRLFGGK